MDPQAPTVSVPPLTDERLLDLQALRDDVRRKYKAAAQHGPGGRYNYVAEHFRLECLLNEGDQLQAAHEALLAQNAALKQELADQEVQMLELVKELEAEKKQSARYHEGFIEWESVAKSFEKALIEAGLLPPAPACGRDCQKCEAGETISDTPAYFVEPRSHPDGSQTYGPYGAGVGLQGEPAQSGIELLMQQAGDSCEQASAQLAESVAKMEEATAALAQQTQRADELEARFCPNCDRTNWEERRGDGCDICKL